MTAPQDAPERETYERAEVWLTRSRLDPNVWVPSATDGDQSVFYNAGGVGGPMIGVSTSRGWPHG